SHSIALCILPQTLEIFLNRFPKITPRFFLGKTPLVKAWIESGAVEFGITVDDGKLNDFERKPIRNGKFVLTSHHALKAKTASFLLTEERPETLFFRRAFRAKYKTDPKVVMEVDSWEVQARLASLKLGIAYIPDFVLNQDRQKSLHIVNLGLPNFHYELCSISLKGQSLSRNAKLFLDLMPIAQG
ncbi:MAG: LysR family transcriptional regulator substrate-binding protein, partial [Chlamydiia bacterium]|nr:LysR family transcriptional regulator substrate-binding protein [Chlamydiia bacterium]